VFHYSRLQAFIQNCYSILSAINVVRSYQMHEQMAAISGSARYLCFDRYYSLELCPNKINLFSNISFSIKMSFQSFIMPLDELFWNRHFEVSLKQYAVDGVVSFPWTRQIVLQLCRVQILQHLGIQKPFSPSSSTYPVSYNSFKMSKFTFQSRSCNFNL